MVRKNAYVGILSASVAVLSACGGIAERPAEPCDELVEAPAAPSTPPAPAVANPEKSSFSGFPCPMTVDELAPRAVPAARGGLILATGCGFSRLREVRVHPDAVGQAEWIAVSFAVIDDAHVLFYSGARDGAGLADAWFRSDDRHVQRYFGFVVSP